MQELRDAVGGVPHKRFQHCVHGPADTARLGGRPGALLLETGGVADELAPEFVRDVNPGCVREHLAGEGGELRGVEAEVVVLGVAGADLGVPPGRWCSRSEGVRSA